MKPNATCSYCGSPVHRKDCPGSGDCGWGAHTHDTATLARPEVSLEALQEALDKVRVQLAGKIRKHGRGAYVSRHEAYGIIAEEHKELLDAIHQNDDAAYEAELLDIIGAAVWAVASRGV